MSLHTTTLGESGPLVAFCHGLFGQGKNWTTVAKAIAEDYRVLLVDMPHHGRSPWPDHFDYVDVADRVAELFRADDPVALVGHSMGGKAAMVLALDRPALVNRLVVADIAPVAYSHSQSHLIAAMRALDPASVETRSDADRALADKIETDEVRAFLLQSLDLKAKRWRLNLDVLDREMSRLTGFPEVTGSFDGPALFLAGALSDYVTPEARPIIKSLFPNARQAKIPGAGHWLHAEKPREFEAAARSFLNA